MTTQNSGLSTLIWCSRHARGDCDKKTIRIRRKIYGSLQSLIAAVILSAGRLVLPLQRTNDVHIGSRRVRSFSVHSFFDSVVTCFDSVVTRNNLTMDEELALNTSDCDLLDEISNTPEVSETSSSPVIPARQPPRLRSAVHVRRRPSPSRSDSSNIVGPSQPHSPRGRIRLRRPSYTADSRRSSPARSRSSHATSLRGNFPPATRRPPVSHRHSRLDSRQPKTDFQLNSASPRRTPLPGYRRNDDVTPPSPAQPPLAQPPPLALTQGQPSYSSLHSYLSSPGSNPDHSRLPDRIFDSNPQRHPLPPLPSSAPQLHPSHSITSSTPHSVFKTIPGVVHSQIADSFRSELDDYLSLTIDLALHFGGNGFYSYHILFASRAAERRQQFNQGTYWGTLDTELYCRIFAARSSLNCEQCGPAPKGVDRRGRPILYQGGRVLCNNFNDLGCNSSNCRFLHTCSFCGGAHARVTCPHNPTKHGSCKYLSTPINIHALTSALKNHPDRQFVHYLLQGFTHGFHPGLHVMPDSSFSCHNLQSANSEPDTVDRLLTKEFTASTLLYDPSRHASVSDISVLSSDTLVYFLKRSKTNQSGQPQPVYIFRLNSFLSPFEPILDYINSRLACRASPRDPLFISETGRVATRSWFHHHFRQILSRSGIPPEPYSGHSFRIGADSTASRQGIPDNITKILGRWSSTAYLTYVRNDLSDDFSRPPINPKTTLTDGPASSLYPSSLLPFFPSLPPSTPHPHIPPTLLPFPSSLPAFIPHPNIPNFRPSSHHPSTPLTLLPTTLFHSTSPTPLNCNL
ncbi:hypothetical protein N1851_028418 [Merluccius polli]|uniref:Uncharacterized protein n=1 Tax=Merluccius polli TaxID=89951 RepID=A0AA47NRI6_MERPO|nr:hypothetical protein N1851_028418 [Merluccius polli]